MREGRREGRKGKGRMRHRNKSGKREGSGKKYDERKKEGVEGGEGDGKMCKEGMARVREVWT